MENFREIFEKFENILWNCETLREISQEILKKYARKKFWGSIKDCKNIIKVVETF